MLGKIVSGSSFKGAALYHLHDKRLEGETVRLTDARVAWTETVNLRTDDPGEGLADHGGDRREPGGAEAGGRDEDDRAEAPPSRSTPIRSPGIRSRSRPRQRCSRRRRRRSTS